MKIIKFKKTSKDKYKLYLDNGESLTLFEDVIVNNNLLLTKKIDKELLDKLNHQNNEQYAYTIAIKYISVRMRSEKEVSEYLVKKGIEKEVINHVINRLIKAGYVNDFDFSKAYINDALLLSNDGPYKIRNNLIKYGVKEEIVNKAMDGINLTIVNEKLSNLIEKQIKIKKGSSGMIKTKLLNYLYNLGYDKESILKKLNNTKVNVDYGYLKKEYDKLYNKYLRKYDSNQLKHIINQKLYAKGYTKEDIDKIKEN